MTLAWGQEAECVLEMRRMYGGYFKGHAGASRLRTRLMGATTRADVLEILLNTSEDDATSEGAPVAVPVARAMPAGAVIWLVHESGLGAFVMAAVDAER